jgi:hypothetical protein
MSTAQKHQSLEYVVELQSSSDDINDVTVMSSAFEVDEIARRQNGNYSFQWI